MTLNVLQYDYRGHVLYHLAVQRLTGLEPRILEELLKTYNV
ncbi:MAG: hypothetical protein ACTSU5_09890 [Promethearchaeota archaeon]